MIDISVYDSHMIELLIHINKSHFVFCLLALSLLTFFLPEEIFDPQLDADYNIFCKSLDSIVYLILLPPLIIEEHTIRSRPSTRICTLHLSPSQSRRGFIYPMSSINSSWRK